MHIFIDIADRLDGLHTGFIEREQLLHGTQTQEILKVLQRIALHGNIYFGFGDHVFINQRDGFNRLFFSSVKLSTRLLHRLCMTACLFQSLFIKLFLVSVFTPGNDPFKSLLEFFD
ncbi:hypothetical protein D3C71_1506740 [compost metagenome]